MPDLGRGRARRSAQLKVEVLNSITPPREFENGALPLRDRAAASILAQPSSSDLDSAAGAAGQAWIQYIASAPATTSEVIALQVRRPFLLAGAHSPAPALRSPLPSCPSSFPAARFFLTPSLLVQAKFDKLLEKHEARETGICPIREALYSQCFDELIRQETVFAAERYEHTAPFLRNRRLSPT